MFFCTFPREKSLGLHGVSTRAITSKSLWAYLVCARRANYFTKFHYSISAGNGSGNRTFWLGRLKLLLDVLGISIAIQLAVRILPVAGTRTWKGD